MNRILHFQNLITMLREIDTQKNDSETLKEVLNFIAQELEKYIDDIK